MSGAVVMLIFMISAGVGTGEWKEVSQKQTLGWVDCELAAHEVNTVSAPELLAFCREETEIQP